MSPDEQPLPGNVTTGVVRVGDTVRRPVGPWTDAVDALLTHLHDVGFDGAPRPLGRDDQGRQVLEYVPGECGHPRVCTGRRNWPRSAGCWPTCTARSPTSCPRSRPAGRCRSGPTARNCSATTTRRRGTWSARHAAGC